LGGDALDRASVAQIGGIDLAMFVEDLDDLRGAPTAGIETNCDGGTRKSVEEVATKVSRVSE
jgi:hypothetical protein